ncbi:MAG: ABC transporter ATP-binding protein [Methanomassiliicoccales archaeon]
MIDVRNVSKRYIIGRKDELMPYRNLSEIITEVFTHPLRAIKNWRVEKEFFWALKDISMTVEEGEVVGLIGRNGAGKTTLLKIISQITYPTTGEIRLRGRVGSLLEVGTGFHPELTGRENIYMNGAILGMKRVEIERSFEEIVRFSELEKFLDTPVKRYSSGMYVRLGFAVAAHLNPEILLVDEVLAVGDVQFQKKCLGKIKDVSQGGRTVLFVSHNMPVLEGLCDKAALIQDGHLKMIGDTHDVIAEYLRYLSLHTGNDLDLPIVKRSGDGRARFTFIELRDEHGDTIESVMEGKPFKIILTLRVLSEIELDKIEITFSDAMSRSILTTRSTDSIRLSKLSIGTHRFEVHISPNPLTSGSYTLGLSCSGPHLQKYDVIDLAYSLSVVPNLQDDALGKRPGIIRLPFEWAKENTP